MSWPNKLQEIESLPPCRAPLKYPIVILIRMRNSDFNLPVIILGSYRHKSLCIKQILCGGWEFSTYLLVMQAISLDHQGLRLAKFAWLSRTRPTSGSPS